MVGPVYLAFPCLGEIFRLATATAATGLGHLRLLWRSAPELRWVLVDGGVWKKHCSCSGGMLRALLEFVDTVAKRSG